jgi:hypothetical protein
MPSSTPKQQHFMQMVHAFQMGKLHSTDLPQGVRSKVAKTAKSMTKKASGEFAAKVEENDDNIDFSILSFKEYIMVESALIEAFSELSEDEAKIITGKIDPKDLKPAPRKAATADEYASNMAAERHARKMQAARAANKKST